MDDLIGRIYRREAVVGIVGVGYVGLPLAHTFWQAGFPVLGFDIDPAKVEALQSGRSYIKHIPAERIAEMRQGDRFGATTDFSRLGEADAIPICVPTPLTEMREPDLSFLEATGEQMQSHLRKGQLVALESATYPGTTRDVLRLILEAGGLVAGEDFLLAFSPEREDPGNPNFTT